MAATDPSEIRNAATILLVRNKGKNPSVLMGQRGKTAAFMPEKFVFPGGAVDQADQLIDVSGYATAETLAKLKLESDDNLAAPLVAAALRETKEETGIDLSPTDVQLRYLFRAVTPPGRPRRFDARFFMAEVDQLKLELNDFSESDGELSHLQWVPLSETRKIDLPFITEVVLAELRARLDGRSDLTGVPYFHHCDGRSFFKRL